VIPKSRLSALGVLLTAFLVCGVVILQTRFVSDLSAFMPRTPTGRQHLLLDQLRYGVIARLVLVGRRRSGPDFHGRWRRAFEVKAHYLSVY
jgi:predicted exporter